MILRGTYRVPAARPRVWEGLGSPEVLRRCTPGCKQLVESPDGAYDAVLEVGIGSIRGRFGGRIQITDRAAGAQYKLSVSISGSAGFVNADGEVDLKDADGETLIEYSGQVAVGGPIAGVGQRMMAAAAKRLVRQFFECLAEALRGESKPRLP